VKPIIISLMFLVNGEIKLDTFEIHQSCGSWFNSNVKVEENKKRKLFSSLEYHVYKDKKVVGYVCAGNEPG
jgi:hypothetical protein